VQRSVDASKLLAQFLARGEQLVALAGEPVALIAARAEPISPRRRLLRGKCGSDAPRSGYSRYG
jgi:hypothetical protein